MNKNSQNSSGIVFPTLAITLTALLLLIGFIATVLNKRSITANFQTISDIAASAGAAAACSSNECFKDSRVLAINVIEEHFNKTTGTLNRDEEINSWNIENATVTIERGRWLQNQNFVAYEKPWQQANLGVPAFSAYNAVRVQIKQNNIFSVLPNLLKGSLSTEVQATAVGRLPAQSEDIPPFAIPICSLLNEQGTFDKKTACHADRLFTESNRYCPADNPACDVVPDFHYSPYTPVQGQNIISDIFHNNPDNLQMKLRWD